MTTEARLVLDKPRNEILDICKMVEKTKSGNKVTAHFRDGSRIVFNKGLRKVYGKNSVCLRTVEDWG